MPEQNKVRLRVLTQNMWGVPVSAIARQVECRMRAFSRHVREYDVICLQEVFKEEQYNWLRTPPPGEETSHPYSHRFVSGIAGTGLAILSKHPIKFVACDIFQAQGHPEMGHHSDYYAAKAVGMAAIEVPGVEELVYVYTTHTVACYERISRLPHRRLERYAPWRMSQLVQMAMFIRSTADCQKGYVVAAGDFNTPHDSPELAALCVVAGLTKTLQPSEPTYTLDNPFNSSSSSFYAWTASEEDMPVQLDHIVVNAKTMAIESSKVVFKDKNLVAPNTPLSDHYGVEAVLLLDPATTESSAGKLLRALPGCKDMSAAYQKQRATFVVKDTEVLDYAKGLLNEGAQRCVRGRWLFTFVAILVACIGWFVAPWVGPAGSVAFGALTAGFVMIGQFQRTTEQHALQQIASNLAFVRELL